MLKIRDKWRGMSPADRIRAQVLTAALMIGLYAPLYMQSSGDLFEANRLISRRKNRMELHTRMDDIDTDGPSVVAMERRIANINEEIRKAEAAFDEMDMGFAPIDFSETQQQLRLELSTLAERTGVFLVTVARKGASGKTAVDAESGRPLLSVQAKASFGQLLHFMQELETLSYQVAVMHVELYTQDPDRNKKAAAYAPNAELTVNLELSM